MNRVRPKHEIWQQCIIWRSARKSELIPTYGLVSTIVPVTPSVRLNAHGEARIPSEGVVLLGDLRDSRFFFPACPGQVIEHEQNNQARLS